MSNTDIGWRNGPFIRFWFAQLISQFGDRINQMALVGLITVRAASGTSESASAVDLAKLLSFTIIPVFVVGPIAGVYVDRWDRRQTLFVCDFIRAVLIFTIPFIFIFWKTMIPIYLIVFLCFCLSRFYVPAKMAFIPDLVDAKHIHAANSWANVSGMIASALGIWLGGMAVEHVGPTGGFILDSLTFFLSGLLILSIPKGTLRFSMAREQWINRSKHMITTLKSTVSGEIKEGIKYIIEHKEIRSLIAVMTILFMAIGSVYVVSIVFVQEAFHSVTKILGHLGIALGAGLFAGSVLYGRWGKSFSRFKTIFMCLIMGGAMMALFAVLVQSTRNLWVAVSLAFALGLVVGPIVVAANTIVHFVCTSDMRGKVFSALEIVMHFGFLVAMLISSILSEHIEHFWILIGVGVLFLFVGVGGFWKFRDHTHVLELKT